MDEPTMGLSPLYVGRVLELIAEINRQGVTVWSSAEEVAAVAKLDGMCVCNRAPLESALIDTIGCNHLHWSSAAFPSVCPVIDVGQSGCALPTGDVLRTRSFARGLGIFVE
jgi:hypothetical protein